MQLVEVKDKEIYCDSHLVARKFGYKHANVVNVIVKLEGDLSKLRVGTNYPKTVSEERVYRGLKYTSYLMNREFFSLLVMRFRGLKALEWQVKFNDAFYQMERMILKADFNTQDQKWISQREQGKIARREETDVIKVFVEYATAQGSKSAKFYYKHITNATYKALGLMVQRKPKLRDAMDLYEMASLILAEKQAQDSIKKYMDLGRDYKDIYESVKDDLVNFGTGLKPG